MSKVMKLQKTLVIWELIACQLIIIAPPPKSWGSTLNNLVIQEQFISRTLFASLNTNNIHNFQLCTQCEYLKFLLYRILLFPRGNKVEQDKRLRLIAKILYKRKIKICWMMLQKHKDTVFSKESSSELCPCQLIN